VSRIPPVREGCRRSAACGPLCKTGTPCVLDTMRLAERLLDQHPELLLWAHAACVAHIYGCPSPSLTDTPATLDLRALMVKERRGVECAIAHAVEHAITARYADLAEFYDPDALSVHLSDSAWDVVAGQSPTTCAADAGAWRAGSERYADIAGALAGLAAGRGAPLTQEEAVEFAGSRGAELGAGTPGEQRAILMTLPWNHFGEARQRALVTGSSDETPSYVGAAARLTEPLPWPEQLAAAMPVLTWAAPDHRKLVETAMGPPAPEVS
jgi:hypothetical protein